MKEDKPIIWSLLDLDFYKLSMGQMILHNHPKTPVTFELINRTTTVRLADAVDASRLREELEHCRTLRFSPQELHYIMGTYEYNRPMFSLDYINFLKQFSLTEFDLEVVDGQFKLSFSGEWSRNTYWETLAMSIIKELLRQSEMKNFSKFERELIEARGRIALGKKIKKIRENPEITFSDFGTRRRFSRNWQDGVVEILVEECPGQFKGTSNVFLAKKYGIMPMGTNAHELPMVYGGIYYDEDELSDPTFSSRKVLKDWEHDYGLDLSIFLPDTFGSRWFFEKVVSKDRLSRWKGSRHDSGDPIQYADYIIGEYKRFGIDPNTKIIVFADNLNVESILEISKILEERIQYTFGWGTDLTDDLGFKPVSIVVKVVEANGHPVAKLSDNIAKATGPKEAVNRMKRLVGYGNTYNAGCNS